MRNRVVRVNRSKITYSLAALLMGFAPWLAAQSSASSPIKTAAPLRVIEFELHLKRIVPQAITAPADPYEIRVLNGVHMSDLVIAVDSEDTGQRLVTHSLPLKTARPRLQMDLKPGRHTVSVVGRPDLKCTIVVTPK